MPVRISALTAPAFLRSLNLPRRVAVLTPSLPACPTLCAPQRATLSLCVCVACIFKCNASKCSVVVQRAVHACEWANEFEYEYMCECRWVWVWWVQTVNEWMNAEMGILRLHCDLENPANWLSLFGLGLGLGLFRLLHSMAAQVVCPPWRMSNRSMLASDILLSNQWQRKQASSKAPNKCASPLICHAHLAWKKRYEVATNTHTYTHSLCGGARLLKSRRCHLTIFMVSASAPAPASAPAATPVTACCSLVRALFNKLLSRLHAGSLCPAPTHRHQQQPQQQQQ